MAFFKFRKGGEDAPAAPTAAESVQEAIHALLGVRVQVRTGERFDLAGCTAAQARGWAHYQITTRR